MGAPHASSGCNRRPPAVLPWPPGHAAGRNWEALMSDDADADLHDPEAAARAAKLHYVSDKRPGITRTRDGDGWVFHEPSGLPITDARVLGRIRKLAIPPAYTDVWICRDPRGHLQAVGRDARSRKQYRYHAKWREVRDEAKYGKMLTFGRVLPTIRAAVRHDLALPGLPKRKVLAAIVALLERTMMRVGNEEYARTNNSFGLTTLHEDHVQVRGSRLTFDFRGKHGVQHHIDLADRRLARVVERCRDLPGQDCREVGPVRPRLSPRLIRKAAERLGDHEGLELPGEQRDLGLDVAGVHGATTLRCRAPPSPLPGPLLPPGASGPGCRPKTLS